MIPFVREGGSTEYGRSEAALYLAELWYLTYDIRPYDT